MRKIHRGQRKKCLFFPLFTITFKKIRQETAEKLNLNRGDLSENADFTVLDEKNQILLREIEECKNFLEIAEVREKNNNNSFVNLGSIVVYLWLNKQEKLTVELTDDVVAEPPQKVSVNSPFGEALLGKKVANKNLTEKREANEKKQQINKAYEVLSDEEKKKRYDLGESNFSTARDTENFEEYIQRMNEQIEEKKSQQLETKLSAETSKFTPLRNGKKPHEEPEKAKAELQVNR
ncbi:16181_t:CDS:2 [Funneliformis geosporum]|nr:16181_t:CDS:2 [Funneliformis geosporum]